MTGDIIEVQNLSKMFKLYPSQGKRFLDYLTFGRKNFYKEFWALQKISFSVQKGSAFGILGQNGSGKSTLLSILAGVLEPTAGSFQVHGNVSAILELGAGFHPEFTGRANVYMYGSIMGLSRDEIDFRMNEIINFSELGDFIDQPIRTYSSGMYARLAFSVAVNVNADILIVDEVLAVGDALFQNRCFRKIHELKESGITILYVGHDIEAVRSICDQAMILDGGQMLSIGDSPKITNEYLTLIADRENRSEKLIQREYGEKPGKNWQIIYNFIECLKDAKMRSDSPDQIKVMNIDVCSTPRKTIFAHPPAEITFFVNIPDNAILSFAVGIYPSAFDKIFDGVQFSVFIEKMEVFNKTLKPKENCSDLGWQNQIIDLNAFKNKKVHIQFVTKGSGKDLSYCWAGWGWIKLYSKPGDRIREIYNSNNQLKIRSNKKSEIHHNDRKLIHDDSFEIGNKKIEIENVYIKNIHGEICSDFFSGEKIQIEVIIFANRTIDKDFFIGSVIYNRYSRIAGTNTYHKGCNIQNIKKGERYKIIFTYNGILRRGLYTVTIGTGIFSKNQKMEVIDRFHKVDEKYFFNITRDNMCDGIVDLCEEVNVEKIFNA